MEAQNGGGLIAAAIAHASTLRLDAAARFVHSRADTKDVAEDVKLKAKMVSRFSGIAKRRLLIPGSGSACAFPSSRKLDQVRDRWFGNK